MPVFLTQSAIRSMRIDSCIGLFTLMFMDYRERIQVNPEIRSGKPCIKGTRITVSDVFDYLGGGMTPEEILEDFPDLAMEDIQACYAYAADRDRRILFRPHEAAV
jgi:uncharacterized protein (DUF433 family)